MSMMPGDQRGIDGQSRARSNQYHSFHARGVFKGKPLRNCPAHAVPEHDRRPNFERVHKRDNIECVFGDCFPTRSRAGAVAKQVYKHGLNRIKLAPIPRESSNESRRRRE